MSKNHCEDMNKATAKFDWFVYLDDGSRHCVPRGHFIKNATKVEAEERAYDILMRSIGEEPARPLYSTWLTFLDEGLEEAVEQALVGGEIFLCKISDLQILPVEKALLQAKQEYDDTLKQMEKRNQREAYEHYLRLKERFEGS